jgi:hypothetical protein
MFVPVLCPICTAVVIVPQRNMLSTGMTHLHRCPSCRSIVCRPREPGPVPGSGHPEVPPPGPPLTRDDLIDFHQQPAGTDPWPSRAPGTPG